MTNIYYTIGLYLAAAGIVWAVMWLGAVNL